MKDSPDADAALTLLADMQELKRWLRNELLWRHDARARAALTKLDVVLVACDKKEAKRLSQVLYVLGARVGGMCGVCLLGEG